VKWGRDLLTTAATLSVLVVVSLWLSDGGLRDLGWTSLGRLTGLVSGDLLLVQVLLLARVPLIERSFGQDQLVRWHRVVGFTSFDLMLAHIVLITIGYAGPTSILGELWRLVVDYPGMLLATAATVALVIVAVTSVRRARRALRYESWHLLHLYAYLGVGLALPHELWTGGDFLASAGARAYWWTAYGVVAAAVLCCRIGLPVYRNIRHRLVVERVVAEAPDVWSVYVRGRYLYQLPVRAGQFFVWRFLDGPGWSRGQPYSLSAAPRGNQLRITVKDVGDGSGRIASLRPGTRVLIEGPYGRLLATGSARRAVLLAAGIGITPLRALLDEIPAADLLVRVSRAEDLIFRTELSALPGVRVTTLVGPRGEGFLPIGYPPDALRRLVPGIADADVYLCGAEDWMHAAADAAVAAGVPEAHLHLEYFTW
jgi:predicted ferric reductase